MDITGENDSHIPLYIEEECSSISTEDTSLSQSKSNASFIETQSQLESTNRYYNSEEFQKAKHYVVQVRDRFCKENSQPTTYSNFLAVLDSYKKNNITVLKAIEQISILFTDHLDLLQDFSYFVPPESKSYFEAKLEEILSQHNLCERLNSIDVDC